MKASSMLASIGLARGHNKHKENRVQKLINIWSQLENKMIAMIERGHGTSLTARCAYAILLMIETGIRVGNESSAEGYICNQKHHPDFGKQVKVYGLTTLLAEHMIMNNSGIVIEFLGKKAVAQMLTTKHPILVQHWNDISSLNLSPFFGVDYKTILRFVKKYIGPSFKPKDIRTAAVNLKFISNIDKTYHLTKNLSRKSDAKKYLATVIEKTADQIGHTKGVCKSSYISKRLIEKISKNMMETVEKNKKKRGK